jgi:hypothetical protein
MRKAKAQLPATVQAAGVIAGAAGMMLFLWLEKMAGGGAASKVLHLIAAFFAVVGAACVVGLASRVFSGEKA